MCQSDKSIFNLKEMKIKKIFKFTLENRGGQFGKFQADCKFSNEVFNLTQKIKELIEQLTHFFRKQ